jgi:hypothetical protein
MSKVVDEVVAANKAYVRDFGAKGQMRIPFALRRLWRTVRPSPARSF